MCFFFKRFFKTIKKMSRPATIPHHLKEQFHNKRCCIDIRDDRVHAIKVNTNNRRWHNEVSAAYATVAVNQKTRRENKLVRTQKEPFHLLSFGCGADTKYWGRYTCNHSKDKSTFHLQYVDDGDLNLCLPRGQSNTSRSYLEKRWAEAFDVAGVKHVYEPATMKLPVCDAFPDGKEYSPDVWLPNQHGFIEIKGPPPSTEEMEKCRLTKTLGFNIQMFRGAPDGFECYEWHKDGSYTKTEHASYYRYLHPSNARKKRRIHNVSH